MHRCLQLAWLGQGDVAPNPMVGAVLVYEDKIIGEGYHQQYGSFHAEANCIHAVKKEDAHLISGSTLYVSLEPCAHFGKTPPCADLIIQKKIPKTVIGCRDPFVQVNGKGIEKLQSAGVEVTLGVLEKECKEINKRFFTFHTHHRPYIVLKWAQTGDRKIAEAPSRPSPGEKEKEAIITKNRLLISNEYTNRIVHKWRREEMAILAGTNTVLLDNPELTTRLWPGKNPVRLVVDMNLRLPKTLHLFNDNKPTIIFNLHRHTLPFDNLTMTDFNGIHYYQIAEDANTIHQIVNAVYQLHIQSVLIEGGAQLLQSFIEEELWDEANIITNEQLITGNGLPAPILQNEVFQYAENFFTDTISYYKHQLY